MKIDIKKAFQGMQLSLDSEGSSHEFMRPTRHWMYILGCSVLVFLGGATYSAVDFYSQFVMPDTVQEVEVKFIRYRDKEVVMIAKSYAEKEYIFETLRADKPAVPETPVVESPAENLEILENENVENVPLAETPVDEYTNTVAIPEESR